MATPVIEEPEPRLLLSADAAGFVVPDFHTVQQPPSELILDENLEPAPVESVVQEESRRLELVFVDAATPDADGLIESLQADRQDNRQLEIITLDGNRDGIWQSTRALANYSEVDAVHIFAHGSEGAPELGNTRIDAESLRIQQDQFLAWGSSLADEADILIYGCNLAASDAGRQLMGDLADLTGADIAASDDLNERGGATTFTAPVSYQTADDGSRVAVESAYVIHDDGSIGFTVGEYDKTREPVIDPALDYTTFVGGTGYDTAEGITVDESGNVYITGHAGPSAFPTTAGAYDETFGGGSYDPC